MTVDRELLKRAAVGLLDAVAVEHGLGHQSSKANRYVLTSRDGTEVELMFEKNESSPANIWCLQSAAGTSLVSKLEPKSSPASKLRSETGKDGKLSYARHSALEHISQLGEADLVCFAPKTLQEFGQIIDRLLSVTRSDIR